MLGSVLLSPSMVDMVSRRAVSVDMVSRRAVSADRGDYRRLGCGSVESLMN